MATMYSYTVWLHCMVTLYGYKMHNGRTYQGVSGIRFYEVERQALHYSRKENVTRVQACLDNPAGLLRKYERQSKNGILCFGWGRVK